MDNVNRLVMLQLHLGPSSSEKLSYNCYIYRKYIQLSSMLACSLFPLICCTSHQAVGWLKLIGLYWRTEFHIRKTNALMQFACKIGATPIVLWVTGMYKYLYIQLTSHKTHEAWCTKNFITWFQHSIILYFQLSLFWLICLKLPITRTPITEKSEWWSKRGKGRDETDDMDKEMQGEGQKHCYCFWGMANEILMVA